MKTTFLLLILGISLFAFGQNGQSYNNGNITASSSDCSVANSCVMLGLANDDSSASITVTGTFSATLQFEVSANYSCTQAGVCSGTWFSKQCFPESSSTGATSATATGLWTCTVAAKNRLRVRGSAYVSGTAVIDLYHSKASASLNQGGGGGTPGGSDTQVQLNNSGAFAGAANLLYNTTTGQITANQKADTNETIYGVRATDTTPTGNFIHYQNFAANSDLFKVDVLGNVIAAGSIGSGTAPAGVGSTATGGFACTEAANTGWTPTATTDYHRCDSTRHATVSSMNGGSEAIDVQGPASATDGNVVSFNGTTGGIVKDSGVAMANLKRRGIAFSIGDPAGSALSAASTTTAYVTVPYACTISAYNLLIDAGTITVKFWKKATGTAIPTSSDSINTSGVAIASGTAIHSATVSDFTTTTVTKDDIVAMNVITTATAKYIQGVLECDQ